MKKNTFLTEPTVYEDQESEKDEPETLTIKVIESLLEKIKTLPFYWRYFNQYFLVLRDFASLGSIEKQYLLQRGVIEKIIDIYLGEDSPLPKKKKKKLKMGDRYDVPNFTNMISMLSLLICSCSTDTTESMGNPPTQIYPILILSERDRAMILHENFIAKLIRDAQNLPETLKLLAHWSWQSNVHSELVLRTLKSVLASAESDKVASIMKVATGILTTKDDYEQPRADFFMTVFLQVLDEKQNFVRFTMEGIKAMHLLASENQYANEYLEKNRSSWMWVESYYRMHHSDIISSHWSSPMSI